MGSPPAAGQAAIGERLPVSEEEAEIIAAEATSASRSLGEPHRAEAARLADAARAGEVPQELFGILADIATASLQGGRARRLYRAEGEKSLTAVLLRTPAGREMKQGLDDVNGALRVLAGRRLEAVRVAMRCPGSFTLTLQSEGFAITLEIGSGAVSVRSLTT